MKLIKLLALVCVISAAYTHADMVEYAGDFSCTQASPALIERAQHAAQLVGFEGNYELLEPTKAGIEINPANSFISVAINPVTKNPFVLVNAEWFEGMNADEQLFLLARSFEWHKEGVQPKAIKIIGWAFIVFNALLALGLALLSNKYDYLLKRFSFLSNMWVRTFARLAVLWLVLFVWMGLITPRIQTPLVCYFAAKHDRQIIQNVIAKTDDKKSAMSALRYYDASIETAVNNGEKYFESSQGVLKKYADELEAAD